MPFAEARAILDIQGSQYIPRLQASRDEANSASRDFVLRDGLTRFRLVHFATHGIVDPRRPEMSGLILSLIDRNG
jgi:CHAT domain-containing protein